MNDEGNENEGDLEGDIIRDICNDISIGDNTSDTQNYRAHHTASVKLHS